MMDEFTRREAMKMAGAAGLGAVAAMAFGRDIVGEKTSPARQSRSRQRFGKGVWSHLRKSYAAGPEALRARTAQLADAGVSLMCVCLEGHRGQGIFAPNDVTPVSPRYPKWDPLKVMTEATAKAKIDLHIWLAVFRSRCNQDLFAKHPETKAIFTTAWKKGRKEQGKWACACQPRVQEHMLNLYRSIAARYNPAGLHLDYIRTGMQCLCNHCAGEMARQGIDIHAVQKRYDSDFVAWRTAGSRGMQRKYAAAKVIDFKDDGTPADADLDRWIAWRVDRLTHFVTSARKMAQSRKMTVSAAVKHYWPRQVPTNAQDWVGWAHSGLLDYLFPMIYTSKPTVLDGVIRENMALLKGAKVAYWPGLGKFSSASKLSAEQLAEQIRIARRHAAPGVIIFHEGVIGEKDLQVLQRF